jgi:hypothetical protein
MRGPVYILWCAVLLILSGCSKSGSLVPIASHPTTFEGYGYSVLGEAEKIENDGDKIFGVGTLLFSNPLANAPKNNITATFAIDDGGSMLFIVRASPTLQDGLHLLFGRSNEVINASLVTGTGTVDLSGPLKGQVGDPNGLLTVQLEITSDSAIRILNEKNKVLATPTGLGEFPGRNFGIKLDRAELFDVILLEG